MLSQIFYNNNKISLIKLRSFKHLTGECFIALNKNVIEEILLSDAPNVQKDHSIRSWPYFANFYTLVISNFYNEDSFVVIAETIELCSKLKE